MSTSNVDRPLRASIEVTAAPRDVWQVVSDLRRTGEWSTECSRAVPLGTVRRGAWMLGFNRRKRVRWATVSRIVEFDPEHEVAWRVLTNGSVWRYQLEAAEAGTRIIETRETPKGIGRFARFFTHAFLGGQHLHDDELETGMRRGLDQIKVIAEQ